MATGQLASGLGQIGGSIGAFGSTDATPVRIIKGQGKVTKAMQDQLLADMGLTNTQLGAFNTGVGEAIDRTNALRPLAVADYQNLIDTSKNYDPWSGPSKYLADIFGQYTNLAKSIPDWTTKNMDLQAFNLGMGGRPTNSYFAPAISRHIASSLFPAIAAGVNTVPGVSAVAEGGRTSNIDNLRKIIADRSGTATMGMELPLAPIAAQTSARNASANNLLNLNTAAQAGIAGWQAQPDTLARLGLFGGSLGEGVGNVAEWGTDKAAGKNSSGGGGGDTSGGMDWMKILQQILGGGGGIPGFASGTSAAAIMGGI